LWLWIRLLNNYVLSNKRDMNAISGDPIDTVPIATGGGGVDLRNYPDLADATQTQANTIPVFETTGQKRLKLTTFQADDFNTRITTNTDDISTGQSNVDVLTTNFDTHAASGVLHANVGKTGQGTNAIALGNLAGVDNQQTNAVAVGANAGKYTQQTNAVAVGTNAGRDTQSNEGIAIGTNTAYNQQGAHAIAIGSGAASQTQGLRAIAIGYLAANTSQGVDAIAIGRECATTGQLANAVAIGSESGKAGQGSNAIAIGASSAQNATQGANSIAIGVAAGANGLGANAIAIGAFASLTGRVDSISIGTSSAASGQNSIAIGKAASAPVNGCININASGAAIPVITQSGLFIDPIRDENTDVSGKVMCYDTSTKEVILRNPPPASTVTETTFHVPTGFTTTFYNDEYVIFSLTSNEYDQVSFVRTAAYAANVNAGQHLTKSGVFSVAGGRYNVTPGSEYWFSNNGAIDNAFALGSNNHVKMWLSSGVGTVVPHYTIELVGGTVNVHLFGVVRRHNH
jgi:hypothetical protein